MTNDREMPHVCKQDGRCWEQEGKIPAPHRNETGPLLQGVGRVQIDWYLPPTFHASLTDISGPGEAGRGS